MAARTTVDRPYYRSINAAVRYEMLSVFQVVRPNVLGAERSAAIAAAGAFFDRLADTGVTPRRVHHVAALRATADCMVWTHWTHADSIEALQAHNNLRRTTVPGRAGSPVAANQLIAGLP